MQIKDDKITNNIFSRSNTNNNSSTNSNTDNTIKMALKIISQNEEVIKY